MSELRRDPLRHQWVVVAPERARPPEGGRAERPSEPAGACPFCPGREAATPPAVLVLHPGPRGPHDWCVRVVPERVPALRVEGNLEASAEGMYDRVTGIGAHEVVIESPDHEASLADLPQAQVERVVEAWQSRLRDLFRDRRLEHVLVVKHHGVQAGARLAHGHSQILATPVIPGRAAARIARARAWFRDRRRCLLCDLLDQELATGSRVVTSDPHVVVLCPYASRVPFELLVIPRRHGAHFGQAAPDEVAALARALGETLRRLRRGLGDPPYHLVIHTAPNPEAYHPTVEPGPELERAWHWHLEILPRLGPVTGWASDAFVNPTPPEDAAAFLRSLPD